MLGKRSMLKTRSSLWRVAGKVARAQARAACSTSSTPCRTDPMGEQLILRIPTLERARAPARRRCVAAARLRRQLTASRNSAIGSPT